MNTHTTNQEDYISRRSFLKGVGVLGISAVLPYNVNASDLNYSQINFDSTLYAHNNAQTIIIYLYGGPSELGGNLTNMEQINTESQNPYPLNIMTPTTNHCWTEAGGDIMESLLANEDMNLFRTCYRTVNDLKAHGECTSQAQRGKHNDGGAGIIANLSSILHYKGAIREPTNEDDIGKSIPFVTMEGESTFFREDNLTLPSFLKPVALDTNSNNPYKRNGWIPKRVINKDTNETLGQLMDDMAQNFNPEGNIKESFNRREILEKFRDEIENIESPVEYPPNNPFADRLEFAMKLLIHNEHTKAISIGNSGLGGWDDHSDAIDNYTDRMKDLMSAIDTAITHMEIENRTNINIVIFGEFGRNVNYNDSQGWDHGNNQNVYWVRGKNNHYMNYLGIVGETEVYGTGNNNRLYTRPKSTSSSFQVFSIAATIYKMYGITNPEILTENNHPINGLLS